MQGVGAEPGAVTELAFPRQRMNSSPEQPSIQINAGFDPNDFSRSSSLFRGCSLEKASERNPRRAKDRSEATKLSHLEKDPQPTPTGPESVACHPCGEPPLHIWRPKQKTSPKPRVRLSRIRPAPHRTKHQVSFKERLLCGVHPLQSRPALESATRKCARAAYPGIWSLV